jgi:regulatory protein
MAVKERPIRSRRPPLDAAGLEQTALNYVGRYATTRAKLAAYLSRKLADRGWSGPDEPPVEAVVARLAGLGYVDDRAFARARAASLSRRGYGERRIGAALRAAGIGREDAQGWQDDAADALAAALRLAERRRIGPFAAVEPDRAGREKALGILLRAGHPPALARRVASCRPGEFPDADGG